MTTTDRERTLPAGAVPADRVTLPPGTVVITDLHLAPFGNARTDHFVRWCQSLEGAPRLCILGDLFDTWVGARQGRIPGSAAVAAALKDLDARGTRVHVIPGNRDALLDASFERCSGATLHMEGFIGEIAGEGTVALVHGDSLCTLDVGYQRLRTVWRNGFVRWSSRHAPLWFARWIGRRMRRESEARKPFKLNEEKSIRGPAVHALAQATGASIVMCGHAHEAVAVDVPSETGPVRRIVVGAWGSSGDVLRVDEDGLFDFDPSAPAVGS